MKRTWLKSVLGHGHRWRWSWEWRDQVLALHRAQAIIEFSPDGIILDANENFLRTVGYERRDIVGKHHRIFVRPEERESEAYRQFWLRLGQGHHDSGLYRRIGKDGREVWIQGSYSPILDRRGRPYKIIKHATDVSDERLQASDTEGQLSAINRSQAVISFDLDGIILDANDNFLTTMGYRREEVVGRHHRMFVDPAERESAEYRDFWTRLRRGEYNAALYRRVRKDGADVWIQASYNPIFDMAGRPFKIVKYATDVTRQTSAARMLQESLGSLADTVPAIAGQAIATVEVACRMNDVAPVEEQQLAGGKAGLRVRIERLLQFKQPVGIGLGIIIEENNDLTARHGDAGIDAAAEEAILGQGNHAYLRIAVAEQP